MKTACLLVLLITLLARVPEGHSGACDDVCAKTTGVTRTRVSVTSATAGTLVSASRIVATRVQVSSTAAVPVWFCSVNAGTACSAVTVTNGCLQVLAINAYIFTVAEEGWAGQICGLLDSGTTAVTVDVQDN